MGSESDFYTDIVEKMRVPSSLSSDGYANVVPGMLCKGLEDMGESRSSALDLLSLVEPHEVSIEDEHKNVESEAQRIVAEEEQGDFPQLSLLKGDCIVDFSNIGIEAEAEYMARMFNDGGDYNGCENSVPISLRLDDVGPLVNVDGDLAVQGEEFFSLPLPGSCAIASVMSNSSSKEGRTEILSNVESYKSNFDNFNDNITNLGEKSIDDNHSQNDLELPLQSSRKIREACQVNCFCSSSEIGTSHQKLVEEILGASHNDHEVSCSAQESTGEPAYCSAVERPTSEMQRIAELDVDGSTFDSFKNSSTCCTIDNDFCTGEKILPVVIANSGSLTSVRRTNPKRAASLRSNLADEKSIPVIRSQSDRRKYRRKFCASTCVPLTIKMFNEVNRKIRSSHRKARHSVWGTVESLYTIIKQRDDLIKHDLVQNAIGRSKSKKAERGVNRTKRTAAMKNKQSRLFSTKVQLSCQSIQPNILAAQNSSEYGTENFLPTDSHTGTSNIKVESKQNMAEKWYVTVRSNMREGQQEEKDLESTLTQETSSDYLLSDFQGVSSRVDLDFTAETSDSKHTSDPGNSPDSDVYNPIIDVGNLTFDGTSINEHGCTSNDDCQIQKFKEDGLTSVASEFMNPFVSHLPLLTRQTEACEIPRRNPMKGHKGISKLKEKKEKKGNIVIGENKGKKKKIGKRIGIHECPFLISDLSPEEGLDCQEKSINVKESSLSSSCSLDCQEACDNVDKCSKVSRTQSGFASDPDNLDFSLGTTSSAVLVGGETVAVDALPKDVSNDVATPIFSESAREPYNMFSGQSSFSGKKAWALCDDCQKWRCVPDELVYVIEKGRWTCKDNVDEAFADCTIPQEKSDEDINNDLGISTELYCSTTTHDYGELAPPRLSAAAQTTWTPIKSNLFLHRSRRTQTIDEIMVCHCKPPRIGGLGCGEECLNRMLNIECVKGTCPCGNLCSNQQFQKRKYAKFKWLKCGKKGYGLQLEDNASSGQFLIEYVGEVLDLAAYEARLRYYASRGQKHFYFMTLNGGEVIDACDKGNLGRFINHSCNPNCRTEKWMVNGEVCIGLFAIRDIKKGEEITFDYNYVRVFGAAAKKCVCGSTDCRGYIGGDPSSSEVIVQDDSDAEDFEPVMLQDVEIDMGVMGIDSVATDAKVANHKNSSVERNDTNENSSMSEQGACVKIHGLENQVPIHQSCDLDLSENLVQSVSGNNISDFSNIESSQEVKLGLSSIETDEIFYENMNEGSRRSAIYRSLSHRELSESPEDSLNSSLQTKHTLHGPVLDDATNVSSQNSCSFMHKRSSATCLAKEILTISKPNSIVKTLRHIKVKRSRISIKSVASGKSKKVSAAISSRHIEGVEEKLNELLDEDGGICRKKDAAKGYLKLLVVTAASGDETKGSMSQSARDLSMILDAMLKTKSRMVLVDIINKNGLQMLHNMMKQNRDNFNRTPILRKLLKVLEFLAEKEILTVDHLYAAPPHSGMESFKESMLKLIKHRDTQVHFIARNFADQWIPRNFHRVEPSERAVRQSCTNYSRSNWSQASNFINPINCQPTSEAEFHGEARHLPTQAASSSASFTDVAPIEIVKSRKRKTRWDQPSDVNKQASQCLPDENMSVKLMRPSQLEPISDIEVPKQGSNNSSEEMIADDDDDGEMPPGFGSSDEVRVAASVGTAIDGETVVIGHPQERYLAHLTVAYGMPVALMFDPSLKIAPAMPFKPFPPLPSYPRPRPCPSNPVRTSFNGNSSYRHDKDRAGYHRYGNGRRFFQPQQWNSQRPRRF